MMIENNHSYIENQAIYTPVLNDMISCWLPSNDKIYEINMDRNIT